MLFTGIVEERGQVMAVEGSREGARLIIRAHTVLADLKVGDSIAVNGVCLTVTAVGRDYFHADVMPETLRKSNLLQLAPGHTVNLERALAWGSRLGGHLVSGHIDGVGHLVWRRQEGNALLFYFRTPPELLRYIIPKGSIAVDGISLTVAFVDQSGFSVSVIPHTAATTTLGGKETGAAVNLEVDLIGKYVEKLLQPYSRDAGSTGGRNITMDLLIEKGFI